MKRRGQARTRQAGFTLIELVITTAILMILASVALPISRVSVQRTKEVDLRRDLLDMRNAIDRYKDLADRNQIRVKAGTDGYPPDLETLVEGVPLAGKPGERIRFLRKIPIDPMTGKTDWGMRCVQDEPDSTSWCGDDIFDVFSQSTGTALDGTKYSSW
ncbi:MAG: prepilin-type N-terminal cleavage/methylation domain-containing protein [Acidobacteriota bacterium]|nr:prepilin-type N-terminal cleavage/methylation domain-containing protein [Acidobacteriota bacterium]